MNADDYINACFDTSTDPNFYQELPSDPNPDHRVKSDEKIYELLSSELTNLKFQNSSLDLKLLTSMVSMILSLH